MDINYIKHLESAFNKISADNRLSTVHLGLYYSLFHQWNLAKFRNPISICRSETMRVSKIGSANTYTRCLKELHKWNYIEYMPSHNPNKGSLVNLYRFDKSSNKSTGNSCDKSTDKGTDNTPVTVVRPSINTLNKLNNETIQTSKQKKAFSPPELHNVKLFFESNNSTPSEGENFYNYFTSNGWLVGGKAKMKDWQAAARNWIKRGANYKNGNRGSSTVDNRLNTNNDKDYAIPL